MGRKRTLQREAERLNKLTIDFYRRRLCSLAISVFDWQNLPPTVDPRFLELTLFNKGFAVFYKDADLDSFLCLTAMISGYWNVYDIPIDRTAYASNDYQFKLTNRDSVLIYNNFMHYPTAIDMELFARRLYEADRAIDVNIRGQKTPKILTCDENQRLVLENLYMQYEGNQPFIFGSKSLDFKGLNSIDTTSPFVADKLQIVKRQIYNEALTVLGIENNSSEKAERLVTNESVTNAAAVKASRATYLAARQQACEQINRMFGLNIWCEYRDGISTDIAMEMRETNAEVVEVE